MKRNSRFTTQEKESAVQRVEKGVSTIPQESKRFGVHGSTIKLWIRNYAVFGINGISEEAPQQHYSKSQKEAAVLEYLTGADSLRTICKKHKIRSVKQLHNWIVKYTTPERVKKPLTGGNPNMIKERKISQEERITIVQFCIEHGLDYIAASKKYQVSYQQVYQWVRKYEEKGIEGLIDRRGKRKPVEEMTELEKLRRENKLLMAEKRRAELEIAFLKKLEEIERRRG